MLLTRGRASLSYVTTSKMSLTVASAWELEFWSRSVWAEFAGVKVRWKDWRRKALLHHQNLQIQTINLLPNCKLIRNIAMLFIVEFTFNQYLSCCILMARLLRVSLKLSLSHVISSPDVFFDGPSFFLFWQLHWVSLNTGIHSNKPCTTLHPTSSHSLRSARTALDWSHHLSSRT